MEIISIEEIEVVPRGPVVICASKLTLPAVAIVHPRSTHRPIRLWVHRHIGSFSLSSRGLSVTFTLLLARISSDIARSNLFNSRIPARRCRQCTRWTARTCPSGRPRSTRRPWPSWRRTCAARSPTSCQSTASSTMPNTPTAVTTPATSAR